MQVALANDTTVSLGIVHRTVRCIQVNECMQPFLYVHTSTKREGTAKDNANFATVHLVEYFLLLLDGHAGTDNNYLVGWHSLRYELLTNIIIQVEAAVLVLIVVSEQGYSAFVLRCLFQ